jgi:putative membrane protein
MGVFIPYCGSPPTPGSLHWNEAPVLAGLVALAPVAYLLLHKSRTAGTTAAFFAGCALFGLCFFSPLCLLGVALFSARSAEHVALIFVVAPLLAAGLLGVSGRSNFFSVFLSALAFASLVWAWHSPRLYDATLQNNVVFWSMNATMIGSALWFWSCVLSSNGLVALAGVSFVGFAMSLLGALIAFAKTPFYSVHALTTTPWGLSQMDDQRVGGLIMWVPAGLLGIAYSAVALGKWFTELGRRRANGRLAFVRVKD